MEFIHYAFNNIHEVVKGHEAELMLSMMYDEYMGMVSYSRAALDESPLLPMRQSPMETHGAYSKERERLRLFAKLRVAEHIPGMDWKTFCGLTPEQTEWVLEIAREEGAAKAKEGQKVAHQIEQMTQHLPNQPGS